MRICSFLPVLQRLSTLSDYRISSTASPSSAIILQRPGPSLIVVRSIFGEAQLISSADISSTVFTSLTRSKPLCMKSFCGLDTNM